MVILTFELEGESYGIPAAQVEEVALPVRVFPFPDAPSIVEGMIHYRGSAVPLVNLRSRFGLPSTREGSDERIVVAETGRGRIAFRAHDPLEVTEIDPGEIETPDGAVMKSRYVSGIAKLHDGLILIHDLETFLDADEADWLEASSGAEQEKLG